MPWNHRHEHNFRVQVTKAPYFGLSDRITFYVLTVHIPFGLRSRFQCTPSQAVKKQNADLVFVLSHLRHRSEVSHLGS